MALPTDSYADSKFGDYVLHLHMDKHPLQHRCTLEANKSPTAKVNASTRVSKRMYVYLILLPYDHYQTKIYHDSFDSVDHARREHANSYPFILHPFSRLRVFFDSIIVLPYLFVTIYLGSVPAFGTNFFQHVYDKISNVILIVGVIYLIFNFMTGYCLQHRRKVVLNPLKIFKHYLISYFLVDVSVLIPHVFTIVHPTIQYVDIFYFFSFIRCFTFLNILCNFLLNCSVNKRVVNRISLVVKLALLLQIISCVMGYAKRLYGLLDVPEEKKHWTVDFVFYVDELVTEMSRFYYSDYSVDSNELLITFLILISVMIGTVAFAYVMAAVLMDMLAGVAQETKYKRLALEVRNFARQGHRDPTVRDRIVQMFDVIFLGTLLKEQKVKQTVPENIRRDLNAETMGVLLKRTTFLSRLDEYLLLRIFDKLKLVVLLPNDHLVTEGQKVDSMFFLTAGRLVIFFKAKELGHLDDGDNFAEGALHSEEYVHPQTIIAGTACFVYKLSRSDYTSCLKF